LRGGWGVLGMVERFPPGGGKRIRRGGSRPPVAQPFRPEAGDLRTETEGAWVDFKKPTLEDMSVPDRDVLRGLRELLAREPVLTLGR
jgi:hypothetical protein